LLNLALNLALIVLDLLKFIDIVFMTVSNWKHSFKGWAILKQHGQLFQIPGCLGVATYEEKFVKLSNKYLVSWSIHFCSIRLNTSSSETYVKQRVPEEFLQIVKCKLVLFRIRLTVLRPQFSRKLKILKVGDRFLTVQYFG